jgi:hypothetical protein
MLFETTETSRSGEMAALLIDHRTSTASKDRFRLDAGLVTHELGLPPDMSWQELKRGIVYSVVERGAVDDIGRTPTTLQHRCGSWCVTLEDVAQ